MELSGGSMRRVRLELVDCRVFWVSTCSDRRVGKGCKHISLRGGVTAALHLRSSCWGRHAFRSNCGDMQNMCHIPSVARRSEASLGGCVRTVMFLGGLLTVLRPPQPRWLKQTGKGAWCLEKGVGAAPARSLGCWWPPSITTYKQIYIHIDTCIHTDRQREWSLTIGVKWYAHTTIRVRHNTRNIQWCGN